MAVAASEPEILVVDDRDERRAALEAVSSALGIHVLHARSAREALRVLLDHEVALVVVETAMPDIDGFELAALVRARERTHDTPIVLVTPHAVDHELLERAVRAGATDCVADPLVSDVARTRLAPYVELYRLRSRHRGGDAAEHAILQLQLASERRYRSLAETLPNIVWTALPDGTVDYFNRRWFEYTGISVERAGGSWLAAVHADDRAPSERAWRESLENGQQHEIECRLKRADGVDRWHLCRAVPERSASGQIVAWLGSFTDVDDAHRAATVLAELKGTLDALVDAVMIFDAADGRMLYANHGATMLYEASQDELLARRPSEVLSGDEPRVRDLLAGETTTLTVETELRRHDASASVEVSFQRIGVDNGRIVAIARDVTDRVRIQREREVLYLETADALRSRDEFISVASHELRTPLAALQLQIEMLREPPRRDPTATLSPAEIQKKLEVAARQVDRVAQLVSNLLDVSRITGGRLRLERSEVDLSVIARDVVERYTAEAARAKCVVDLSVPESMVGHWDRMRIEQVVTNLLTNAFKFGAGKPIEIAVAGDASRARLTVTDHGIGIAFKDAERIFQRYEQAIAPRSYGGMGLGLYIVRGIVEAHGGTVHVTSEPGLGSTFVVELPRRP